MKIGIFGGSFNPPHYMHKNIALELIANGYVDKVIYVPTGEKYPKKGLGTFEDRYEMVNRMINDNPNLEVSDYEKDNLTYTYQTLDYFQNKFIDDEIYFICGTDNFKVINTWRNYQYILDNYKLIIIPRNDDNIETLINTLGGNIIIPSISYSVISSTEVRAELKKDRHSKKLTRKIPKPVLNYIHENNLYS